MSKIKRHCQGDLCLAGCSCNCRPCRVADRVDEQQREFDRKYRNRNKNEQSLSRLNGIEKHLDALEQWNMRLCVAIRDVSRKLSNELGVDMVNHIFELTEPPDSHGDVDSG